MYNVLKKNEKYYLMNDKKIISFINDINYKDNNKINMVCEIPRGTKKKMEISYEQNNPIIQDKINGKLREFTYGNIPWNYGAIPQTLESKDHKFENMDYYGDGDPLDAIDVSVINAKIGDIIKLKIIGILPLIDNNETDWKVIGINVKDPRNIIVDCVEDLYPFEKNKIYDWFINYKKDRGIINKVGLNQFIQDKEYAMKIIDECNYLWKINRNKL